MTSKPSAGLARLPGLAALAFLFFSNIVNLASAMCPLCVAGAAAGLAIARYYGVDDAIVGLWLGALAVSTGLWLAKVVGSRTKRKIPLQSAMVFSAVVIATVVPFYFAGFFRGMPGMSDELFGINKVLFGVIVGSVATYAGGPLSQKIKKLRKGEFIPYQTILVTLGLLAFLSLAFWYLAVV